jgi:hypothetical protein
MLAVLPRGNQRALAEAIIREGLSARETERFVALAARARGRAAEVLLAQPRAAIGHLDRHRTDPERGGQAWGGLVQDIGRATELLARVARGLAALGARDREPLLEPALAALHAQMAVVDSQMRATSLEAVA